MLNAFVRSSEMLCAEPEKEGKEFLTTYPPKIEADI